MRKNVVYFGWTVERGDREIDLQIQATAHPGHDRTHWEPSEPPTADLIAYIDEPNSPDNGKGIVLTDKEYEEIEGEAITKAQEQLKSDYEDYCDRKYKEMRKER